MIWGRGKTNKTDSKMARLGGEMLDAGKTLRLREMKAAM